MTALAPVEALAGGLLLFFVPGYAIAKASFPEWRVRGEGGLPRLVELVTLSFVLSVVLTVLVGYGLLNLAPGGFAASWSDPVLEAVLAAVAVVALVVAVLRGAFARVPPVTRLTEADSGAEGAWELSRELERLSRDERRLEHALRASSRDSNERSRLTQELESVRAERDALRRRREEQYAS